MGNPKQKWTSEEEEALRAGVAKHGAGKWKNIQRDPEFNHLLYARSNIDLKDKWRNLSVANGQGSRDKVKVPKVKGNPADVPATPLAIAPVSTPIASSSQPTTSVDVVMSDSAKNPPEGNNAAKYNTLIFEALSTHKEPNGLDASAIATYIEQRHDVQQNFKRWLSSRLRRLVQQDKLEKVQNCYRIKRDPQLEPRNLLARQKDSRPRQVQGIGDLGDTIEEASVGAAYRIAEAENKSFVAAESVKEAERVSTMAEDMESLLQFASYCFEQSACGEIVLTA